MPNQAKSNQQQAEAVQWQEIPNPEILPPGFTRLPSKDTGVQFINSLDQTKSLMNQVFLNGSGVALGDVNGDGLMSIGPSPDGVSLFALTDHVVSND